MYCFALLAQARSGGGKRRTVLVDRKECPLLDESLACLSGSSTGVTEELLLLLR